MSKVILITGGSRSGKSVLAEKKAKELAGSDVLYIATAIPTDDDMRERIRKHQERREATNWGTYEGYRDLGQIIEHTEKGTILLDCITVLITNILFEEERDFDKLDGSQIEDIEADVMQELGNVIKGARDGNKTLILVTNEVGMSIVPSYRLGRIFSDMAGKANQLLSSLSDEVYISICGNALRLK